MRLDSFLFETGKYPSRNKASEAILKGEVLYDKKMVKPSKEVVNEELISYVLADSKFVSNGGYKLSRAIKTFRFYSLLIFIVNYVEKINLNEPKAKTK